MAVTKLTAPVRNPMTGEATTIAQLADAGIIEWNRVDKFYKRGGGTRVAYFADVVDTAGKNWGGFEVSPYAYGSRTGKPTHLQENAAAAKLHPKPLEWVW